MSGRQRPAVLVIAEAANPNWTSVPLIGWSLAEALREVADVHLVTQIRNRDDILAHGWVQGRDFTALDTEPLARPLWKLGSVLQMGSGKGWTTLMAVDSLIYPYFERLVWRQFGAAIEAGAYDVVHRITPLSPTSVGPLAARCRKAGVPFVIGPLNGGVPWPKGFDGDRRREREWLSYVRSIYKLRPGRARMLAATSAILTGSRHTMGEMPVRHRPKTIYIPENAVDPSRFNLVATQDISGPLRAAFVGRLVPYKGPEMLLEAMAPLLATRRMVLDIVGAGPLDDALRGLAAGLPPGAVTFHGWLDHGSVQQILANANLLTFPSIREFGGGVILEAMALGVVPVVCDYAGPGELVDDTVGFRIPMGSRGEIVAGLRARLTAICDAPQDLPALGRAARTRIADRFTWARKASQLADVYDFVRDRRPARPDPFHANPQPAD